MFPHFGERYHQAFLDALGEIAEASIHTRRHKLKDWKKSQAHERGISLGEGEIVSKSTNSSINRIKFYDVLFFMYVMELQKAISATNENMQCEGDVIIFKWENI